MLCLWYLTTTMMAWQAVIWYLWGCLHESFSSIQRRCVPSSFKWNNTISLILLIKSCLVSSYNLIQCSFSYIVVPLHLKRSFYLCRNALGGNSNIRSLVLGENVTNCSNVFISFSSNIRSLVFGWTCDQLFKCIYQF